MTPTIVPAGDCALLVTCAGDDAAAAAQARSLARRLRRATALRDVVAAYRTVLVEYDPLRTTATAVEATIAAALRARHPLPDQPARQIDLPICYGGDHGPDLESVALHCGLSATSVIDQHSSAAYTVVFLGFTPGFAFLRGLPAALATPRLATPRPRVPAGSVGIAGEQTGFYPIDSPGGWQVIGRIPYQLYDPARPHLILCQPGDHVRFTPITQAAYVSLAATADTLLNDRVRQQQRGQTHDQ